MSDGTFAFAHRFRGDAEVLEFPSEFERDAVVELINKEPTTKILPDAAILLQVPRDATFHDVESSRVAIVWPHPVQLKENRVALYDTLRVTTKDACGRCTQVYTNIKWPDVMDISSTDARDAIVLFINKQPAATIHDGKNWVPSLELSDALKHHVEATVPTDSVIVDVVANTIATTDERCTSHFPPKCR
jgi:hypothetical protein